MLTTKSNKSKCILREKVLHGCLSSYSIIFITHLTKYVDITTSYCLPLTIVIIGIDEGSSRLDSSLTRLAAGTLGLFAGASFFSFLPACLLGLYLITDLRDIVKAT